MKKKVFNFDIIANDNGEINLKEQVDIPIALIIKQIKVKTNSGCRERIHKTTFKVNQKTILDSVSLCDCKEYDCSNSFRVERGQVSMELISEDFDAKEEVSGIVEVEIAIFLKSLPQNL